MSKPMNARELIASEVYKAMQWACKNNRGDFAPKWVDGGNSFAQDEARKAANAILAIQPEIVRAMKGLGIG